VALFFGITFIDYFRWASRCRNFCGRTPRACPDHGQYLISICARLTAKHVVEVIMSTVNQHSHAGTLADESFMSANDLRSYMADLEMARASRLEAAMSKAEEAQRKLIETLRETIVVTPEKVDEIRHNIALKTRAAAKRGETDVLVMRFPSQLCSDGGRAINNAEAGWPDTLTGRPRQAFEFWREHLQPVGYRLRAMIIDWPGGLPGDVAFFLSWSEK